MRYLLIAFLCVLSAVSCGYDFYMNRPHVAQTIHFSRGDKSLVLDAETSAGDDFFRSHLTSDFFKGYADIVYENGDFNINYRNLPIDEDQIPQLKKDLYAAFFAGDYPYKASKKLFGKTEMVNDTKSIYDTDGYMIYKVHYGTSQISLYNIIGEYSIVVDYMSGSRQN